MSKDFVDLARDVATGMRTLREGAPDTMSGFDALAKAAMTAGRLDTKTKELMAVAIAVAGRCDGCIAAHVKAAHKRGASKQEIFETIAVAVYMGGGPSVVYGAEALRAYEQFAAQPATTNLPRN